MISRFYAYNFLVVSALVADVVLLNLFRHYYPESERLDAINSMTVLMLLLAVSLFLYSSTCSFYSLLKHRHASRIQVYRHVEKKRLHDGDYTYVELTIDNPTATRYNIVRVVDRYPPEFVLVAGSNAVTVTMPAYSTFNFGYVLRAQRRGIYQIGGTHIFVTDDAHYNIDEFWVDNRTQIVVYPRVHRPRPSHHVAMRWLSGSSRSKLKGKGFDYTGSRKYIAGDEHKLIDWNLLAKTTELGTKEFRIETEKDIVLVLDSGNTMAEGTAKSKLDYAAEAVAYIANKFLGRGDRVWLVHKMPTGMKISFFAGSGAEVQLLSILAALKPHGEFDLRTALQIASAKVRSRATIVLLTDDATEKLADALRLTAQYRHNIVVILLFFPLPLYAQFTKKTALTANLMSIEQFAYYVELKAQVRKLGAHCLLTLPEQLIPALTDPRVMP